MSNRHELGNMIFNLEERKNLKEVNFTKDAVREVLGYLKELYEIKNKEHEEDRRVADLEAKLADSEEKCKKAYQEGLLQKQFDKDMEIEQLKQQLAEKENEYQSLVNALKNAEDLEEHDHRIRTDFAVEQLEKLKYDFFDIANGWWLCFKNGTQYMTHNELNGCVNEIIDNQIKQLKEGK